MAKKKPGMTGAEWLACTKPKTLLRSARSRISDRKRRLFAAACCRRIWNLLPDERSQRAVETVEQFADGTATLEDLSAAEKAAAAAEEATTAEGHRDAANAVFAIACPDVGWDIAETIVGCVANAIRAAGGRGAAAEEEAAQVALLRDIVGNPFRRPPVVDPDVLAWQNGLIVNMAQAIYDDRTLPAGILDAARLGVLADALEDAGCTDEAILKHLRGSGEHARGCWILDLLLNRE